MRSSSIDLACTCLFLCRARAERAPRFNRKLTSSQRQSVRSERKRASFRWFLRKQKEEEGEKKKEN